MYMILVPNSFTSGACPKDELTTIPRKPSEPDHTVLEVGKSVVGDVTCLDHGNSDQEYVYYKVAGDHLTVLWIFHIFIINILPNFVILSWLVLTSL